MAEYVAVGVLKLAARAREETMQESMAPMNFTAIAFDLLTALVDSWTLWANVAGSDELGRPWRTTSLRIITSAGVYQPYEEMIRRAAVEGTR